jgi:CheY-like chemotaxis protein
MHNQKLVLIVENDRVIRILTTELILEGGVSVVDAADGEEAIELLERRAAEVAALITDIRMPGNCSGLDLAQRVASRWPWISILVTSGYYSERPPGLPQQAQFLSKPWEPEVILDFVQWAVRSDFG